MEIELLDREPATAPQRALAPSATPADLLRIAVENGADLDRLERLMALQERWQATEARKAYDAAFAAFKAEAVTIIKNRAVTAGPLNGKKYAELFAVVNAVTPALSKHGLSSAWQITKDEREWLEVTCTLRHAAGHSESVSMGGPPDAGGAKNAIQARASTVSYLQRYTLKAITGLSEQEDDTDGGHKPEAKAKAIPPELLATARDKAMEGWKALAAWIKTLSDEQVQLLEPESANLKAAAKEADAKGAK